MPFKNPEDKKKWSEKYMSTEYRERGLRATRRYNDRKRAIVSAFKGKPCVDCGGSFPPECMDFDHVRGEKSFQIGSRLSSMSLDKVLSEMEKCDIVCANCHRIRTRARRQRKPREL